MKELTINGDGTSTVDVTSDLIRIGLKPRGQSIEYHTIKVRFHLTGSTVDGLNAAVDTLSLSTWLINSFDNVVLIDAVEAPDLTALDVMGSQSQTIGYWGKAILTSVKGMISGLDTSVGDVAILGVTFIYE